MEKENGSGLDSLFLVKSLDVFKDLDMESVYQLIKASCFRSFAKNSMVLSSGDRGDNIHVLIKGLLEAFHSADGKHAGFIDPGRIIGDISQSGCMNKVIEVRAIEEALTLEFARDEFIRLLSNNGAIAVSFVRIFGKRLRNTLEASS